MPFVPDIRPVGGFVPDKDQVPQARGFFDKIAESFERGQETILSHVGVSNALSDPTLDLQGAEIVARKLRRKEALDPTESGFLSDIVYKSARTVGQMWEIVKEGGPKAIVGGFVGAATGAVAGLALAGPTGEEIPLTVAGMKLGAELAGSSAAALFSYHEGRGGMYLDMIEQGSDPDAAKRIASIAAIPYALIEVSQLKTAAPGIKKALQETAQKSVAGILKKFGTQYGKKLTSEVIQELEQEIIQITSEDLAREASGKGIPIGVDALKERAMRILQTAKEATKGFALVPIPGAGIETAIAVSAQEVAQQVERAQSEIPFTIQEEQLLAMGKDAPSNVLVDDSGKVFIEEVQGKEFGKEEPDAEQRVETILYHGSPVGGLTEIKPGRGDYGYGVYMASEKRARKDYAPGRKNVAAYVLGDTKTPPPEGFVYPIKSPLKNPLIINTQQDYTNLLDEHNDSDKGIGEYARKAGYDGIINNYTEEHIVFTDKPIPVTATAKGTFGGKGLTEVREKPDGTGGIFVTGTNTELHLDTNLSTFADKVRKGKIVPRTGNKITVSDMNTPEGKFFVGFRQAMATLKEQKKIRKQERFPRLKILEEIRKTETGEDWWHLALGAMSGDYVKLGIDPLKTFVPTEVYQQLSEQLRTTKKLRPIEAVKLAEAVQNLFEKGELLRDHEIKYARKVWGDNLANLMSSAKDHPGVNWVDYLSVPKTISASLDLSRTLRQNALIIARHPVKAARALVRDWHLLLKDEKTARLIEKDYLLKLGDKVKYIRWNEWGALADYITGTEKFPSKVARIVPGIDRSERAYVMGGNALRAELLMQAIDANGGRLSEKQLKDIGHVINITTGEGDLKLLKPLGPILNAVFFAPRLLESRVRTITDLFNPRLSWVARKMLAGDIITFVGLNASILLAGFLAGADVEIDPRSSDFGKIKIGKTRIDFFGGYLPLVRMVARMVTGEIKTQSGRIVPTQGMKDTVINFLQAKLGPVPSFVLDLYNGQTFYGDYRGWDADSLAKEFYNKLTPFFIQDIADAIRYQGLGTGLAITPLAFLGAGVNSYEMNKGAQVLQLKNTYSLRLLGKKWDELGPDVQKYLREMQPELDIAERQEAFDRQNFSFLERMAVQHKQSQKKLYKLLPEDVQHEFDRLNLNVSGVSRTIDADWFLNDRRYQQYEMIVSRMYKPLLTKLVRLPKWANVPDEMKVQLLQKIMDDVKQKAREEIILAAKIDDFKKIQRK